jgi:glycosyltransferase involved in cell wall biosynthesis
MTRVLIFSLAYYPHVGGAEVAIKESTDRISDIDFEMITLRFADEPREETVGNVRVHRVTGGRSYLAKVLYVPRAALLARRLHRARPFDAFWAMMSYMTFPIVLARGIGVRVPYLVTLQEGDPFEHVFSRARIRLVRPLLSLGFRRAGAVQAISAFLAAWAKSAGFPGTPVVVPNGVDTARFAAPVAEGARTALRRALGLKADDVVLVTTSRLVEKNAVDDVIRALALLPETVHFAIYGIGPDEEALKALAKAQGVEGRTHFLGQISHDEMPRALAACDLFIRPSRSEGMGNSFIEAMAAGLPVIATQEGGIADFLFDATRNPDTEPTGWAVDKDSPEQIAATVKSIIAHPEQVARVTATARQMALEKYDWDDIAARMQVLFDRLLENG